MGLIKTYRGVPDGWAFALAAIVSWFLAVIAGVVGAFAGVYLYDRGDSKGDDIAVFASGLLAVSTFVLVVLFPWLRRLRREISWRTPLFAWLFCLAVSLLITVWLWPAGDLDHYLGFIVVGWMVILLLGWLGWFFPGACLFTNQTSNTNERCGGEVRL